MCFEPKGSSSGRRLCIQVRYSVFYMSKLQQKAFISYLSIKYLNFLNIYTENTVVKSCDKKLKSTWTYKTIRCYIIGFSGNAIQCLRMFYKVIVEYCISSLVVRRVCSIWRSKMLVECWSNWSMYIAGGDKMWGLKINWYIGLFLPVFCIGISSLW
jgi:hypothetical protein